MSAPHRIISSYPPSMTASEAEASVGEIGDLVDSAPPSGSLRSKEEDGCGGATTNILAGGDDEAAEPEVVATTGGVVGGEDGMLWQSALKRFERESTPPKSTAAEPEDAPAPLSAVVGQEGQHPSDDVYPSLVAETQDEPSAAAAADDPQQTAEEGMMEQPSHGDQHSSTTMPKTLEVQSAAGEGSTVQSAPPRNQPTAADPQQTAEEGNTSTTTPPIKNEPSASSRALEQNGSQSFLQRYTMPIIIVLLLIIVGLLAIIAAELLVNPKSGAHGSDANNAIYAPTPQQPPTSQSSSQPTSQSSRQPSSQLLSQSQSPSPLGSPTPSPSKASVVNTLFCGATYTSMYMDVPSVYSYYSKNTAMYENTYVIGAPYENEGEGLVNVMIRDEGIQAVLYPPVTNKNDTMRFGWNVDMYNDTVVVAEYRAVDSSDPIHIFVRNGTTWTHQATLFVPTIVGVTNNTFVSRVAIYDDTVVVGTREGNGLSTYRGWAHVYVRDGGGQWAYQAELNSEDGRIEPITSSKELANSFGDSVDIYEDTVIIGKPMDGRAWTPTRGSVSVFVRSGEAWAFQAR
ncbi:hypothetical protein ACHAXR_002420, partial [Thalassiosira sp. AJA248-18]